MEYQVKWIHGVAGTVAHVGYVELGKVFSVPEEISFEMAEKLLSQKRVSKLKKVKED